jgi:hypothetical protein
LAKRDIFREFYLFNLGAFSGVLLYLWKNSWEFGESLPAAIPDSESSSNP